MSSDPSVVAVSPSGVLTGIGGGNATITASFRESSAAIPVTVRGRPATLVDQTLNPATASGYYALPGPQEGSLSITFAITLYPLAILTSAACTGLLFREYRRRRIRMLLWSTLCFVCLTGSNLLLFVDLVAFPAIDLRLYRLIVALAGLLCLLYGFI